MTTHADLPFDEAAGATVVLVQDPAEVRQGLNPTQRFNRNVAVRLLQLKQQARCDPQQSAKKVVPVIYVQVLAAQRNKSRKMSVREFWHQVAQLGGFLGRKSDGDPGWLTTWRGWQELELLVAGAKLQANIRKRR